MSEEESEQNGSEQTIQIPDLYAEYAVWSNFGNLKDDALEAVETIREADKSDRAEFYHEVTDEAQKIALYFIWKNLLVEDLLLSLVKSRIIGPDNVTPELDSFLRSRWVSFHFLRELLFKAEVIDEGLNAEIKRSRTIRNEIIHNPTSFVAFDISVIDVQNLDSEIKRGYNLVEKMFDV